MDDTELYSTLLGIALPWRVRRVQGNMVAERVDVWVEEAPGTKFPCAGCAQPAPVYDHTPGQVWRHLDTCQCATYVHARLPRTTCPVDGVKQVPAPWAEGRSEYTRLFETRILDTCKECDVTGVRRLLRTTWDATWGVLARAVTRGLARKPRRVPARLGIDEKAIRKGHHYETLVIDLDTGTVEAVLDDRTQASLEAYYRQFTPAELAPIEAIAMDMWEPYILATQPCVPEAARKIVFDKYHATRYVTEAVDKVRRQEHKALQAQGDLAAHRHQAPLALERGKCPRVAPGRVRRAEARRAQAEPRLGDQGVTAGVLGLRLPAVRGEALLRLVLLGHALAPPPDDRGGPDPEAAPAEPPDLLHALDHQRHG